MSNTPSLIVEKNFFYEFAAQPVSSVSNDIHSSFRKPCKLATSCKESVIVGTSMVSQ